MKRKLKWAIIRLSEITLITLAIFYSQVWAGRLIFFWFIYSFLAILFIVIIRFFFAGIVLLASKSAVLEKDKKKLAVLKEVQTKFLKSLQDRTVPRSINFLSDAIQIGLLIGAGFWITGTLKTINAVVWFFTTLPTQEHLNSEKNKSLTNWLKK